MYPQILIRRNGFVKKIRSIIASIVTTVCALVMVMGFAACSNEAPAEKSIVATYNYGYVATLNCVDTLTIYDDNSYQLVTTQISSAVQRDETGAVTSSIVYMNTSVIAYGTYTKSEPIDDSYVKIELSAATRVIYCSTVMSGMFVKAYDSETSQFPVTYMGDDVTEISKEQFMSDYGSAKTYYIVLDGEVRETTQLVAEMN